MDKFYIEKAAEILSPPLYYSQLHRITKPFYSGIGQILMFHRVLPENRKLRIHNHKSLEVTPEFLENIIRFFKKLNYQFVSLDELQAFRKGPAPKRKMVVFTFDDGYVDNYTYAYPIFEKYKIPFTIYVATNLPDGNAVLWWYLLEDLIVGNSKIEWVIDDMKMAYKSETAKDKEIAFNKIRSILAKADGYKLKRMSEALFQNNDGEIKEKTKELAMSWDQIIQLSKSSLVTIGSHTVHHLPLDSLTREQSHYEIMESKKIIESRIASEVRHFCYPLGSYGMKEISIMENSGYTTGTTIQMANLFEGNLDHPYTLPRIMINSLTNEKILTLQINGLLPALRNKFKRVIK